MAPLGHFILPFLNNLMPKSYFVVLTHLHIIFWNLLFDILNKLVDLLKEYVPNLKNKLLYYLCLSFVIPIYKNFNSIKVLFQPKLLHNECIKYHLFNFVTKHVTFFNYEKKAQFHK